MHYLPPFTILSQWMDRYATAGTTCLTPPFDDLLDVLKGLLHEIPVDDAWYKAEYPAVEDFMVRAPTETPRSHFQKHGYFEGRKPFAPGWRGLTELVPFNQLKTRLRIIPLHGRLRVDIERNDLLDIIKTLLRAVPVDEAWYRTHYPEVVEAVDDKTVPSVAYHYAERGYFECRLPFEFAVDADWYVSRYQHVKAGLERGYAASAQQHFMHLGYKEGCRPTPP